MTPFELRDMIIRVVHRAVGYISRDQIREALAREGLDVSDADFGFALQLARADLKVFKRRGLITFGALGGADARFLNPSAE